MNGTSWNGVHNGGVKVAVCSLATAKDIRERFVRHQAANTRLFRPFCTQWKLLTAEDLQVSKADLSNSLDVVVVYSGYPI